jgi:serine O-acetyltransferase
LCIITAKRLLYADLLRIFAAFGVIVIHVGATGWYTKAAYIWDWQIMNMWHSIFRWPFPLFVMISGMFNIERNVMNMFDKLIKMNCHSKNKMLKKIAANLLEKFYCCEIHCVEIDKSVLFAHHARGCIIVASKICENVVIYQNVTIGSNLKFNKIKNEWENIGNPIIGKNVTIADGAKIFGPIIIGENSFVAAGAVITKDIPVNSIAYGVNQVRPKDSNYDLGYRSDMIHFEKIIEANYKLIERFNGK